MSPRWIEIDHITIQLYYLTADDSCYFAREYTSGGGYGASEANQLIINFKKPVARRHLPEYKYKTVAITRFAAEMAAFIPPGATIAAMPTSKCREDADYDDRLIQTLAEVAARRPDIVVIDLLTIAKSVDAAHEGGSRDPATLIANLRWCGTVPPLREVILIDDVIGSGGHFVACRELIHQHWPHCRVVGVFWARAVDTA